MIPVVMTLKFLRATYVTCRETLLFEVSPTLRVLTVNKARTTSFSLPLAKKDINATLSF